MNKLALTQKVCQKRILIARRPGSSVFKRKHSRLIEGKSLAEESGYFSPSFKTLFRFHPGGELPAHLLEEKAEETIWKKGLSRSFVIKTLTSFTSAVPTELIEAMRG